MLPVRSADQSVAELRPICVFGPLPPPVHGMAKANAEMVAALARERPVTTLNIAAAGLTRNARYHFVKLMRVAATYPRLLWARRRGARLLYASVDDGLGGWWAVLAVLTARMAGMRVYLHHHSFKYIITRTRTLATLVRCAGAGAVHVALCPGMAKRLADTYPGIAQLRVVSNSVDVPPLPATLPGAAPLRAPGPLRIGMLANLTFEKGLDTFIALVEAARSRGIVLEAVLAGPIPIAAERSAAEAAVARNADTLTWLGRVSGADKETFFADIDLLVLPTRYPTEAYPLVLLEALVRGVGTIAPDRGCIGALAVHPAAMTIPATEDFVAAALPLLLQAAAVPGARRAAIRGAGLALNAANAQARDALVRELLAAA